MLNETKNYFKNLDALRTIAALSVVGFHCVNGFKYPEETIYLVIGKIISFNGIGGPLGVSFFFILSGFLITYLIFQELKKNQKFNLLYFYMRRFLRIWPLYFLTLLAGFILYPLVMEAFGNGYEETANGWMFAFFLANFDHIRMQGSPAVGILGVHWSLAVEEQFYLLWPFIFLFIKKIRFILICFVCIFLCSEAFYWMNDNSFVRYYHLLSNMRFLVAGGIIAYIAFFERILLERVVNYGGKLFKGAFYCSCIILLFFSQELSTFEVLKYLLHFVPILFFSYVIAEQCFSTTKLLDCGKLKYLTAIGKASYSVYLLHMFVIYGILNFFDKEDPYYLRLISTFILTIFIAFASYNFFEKPFLKWKSKFNV